MQKSSILKGYYFRYLEHLDQYQIEGPTGTFTGSFKFAATRAAQMGVELDELEMALDFFLTQGHNEAHFGTLGKFIFSTREDLTAH